ncbi:MAG: SDR family NAD(P)-dependent oxidoreductase [Eubacteriales bacterium]|nr:SDR family NAD(P)-dependent oxidoreductase [Eubacteriales bacterium]
MRIAVITGASSGLGKLFAKEIVRTEKDIDGFWLIARREEKLQETADSLPLPSRIFPLDLTDLSSFNIIKNALRESDVEVGILINAAGFGKIGNYQRVSREDSDRMIDLNCRAAVDMTMLCLPYMRRGDRVMEICSTAAFQPFPYLNIYAATKSFLYNYSRALRWELRPRGITVTAVCPYWMKDTEFIPFAQKNDACQSTKDAIRGYPLSQKSVAVVRRALRDSRIGLAVSTPGIVPTVHRISAKVIPRSLMMWIWEGLRRL